MSGIAASAANTTGRILLIPIFRTFMVLLVWGRSLPSGL